MKKRFFTLIILVIFTITLSACGNTRIINGTEYDTYGILNAEDMKNPEIAYRIIWGNVFWGIILCELIVPPIYFFGFSMFEPVGAKPTIKGQVVR